MGYAAGDNGELNLKTLQGEQAIALVRKQADFILANLKGKNGLVQRRSDPGGKLTPVSPSIAQFAIRGSDRRLPGHLGCQSTAPRRELFIAADKAYFKPGRPEPAAGKQVNTPPDPGRHLRRPALCHAEPAQRRGREGTWSWSWPA